MINAKEQDYPLISIITVVYNGEKYLEQAILSVISQSYPNKEYIVIDGGSSDNTSEIIKKYEDRINYWISEPDKGIYDAINKGISLSKGDLIGIVNSDDWLEPEILGKVADYYNKNTDADVFHGILRFIKDGKEYMLRGSSSNAFPDGMIEHPSFFIKKKIYTAFGMYSLEYKSASDLDFILKLYSNNVKFLLMPFVISNFRNGGTSDSEVGSKETLSIKRKYKLINSRKYFIESIKNSLRKYIS